MTTPVLRRIHHVAYRCHDARATVEWYERMLGMRYTTAFAEDHVPSTGEFDPNGHRLELACNIGTAEQQAELTALAPVMLEERSRTRRAPRQAAWLHQTPEASA